MGVIVIGILDYIGLSLSSIYFMDNLVMDRCKNVSWFGKKCEDLEEILDRREEIWMHF